MFEESMMSEMNEDQREVIWTKAKFQPVWFGRITV